VKENISKRKENCFLLGQRTKAKLYLLLFKGLPKKKTLVLQSGIIFHLDKIDEKFC
jgi:hypothetical protein